MAIPYTNPYIGQWYLDYLDSYDYGCVPLAPCKDAYSIGPAITDTGSLLVAFGTYGYNFGASLYRSNTTLIMDENEKFYAVVNVWRDPNIEMWVSTYDGTTGTTTHYEITTPDEILDLGLTGSDLQLFNWMLRKKSATQLDLVLEVTATGGIHYIQHYIWTIGSSTVTYIGGVSYDGATYGDGSFLTLHGAQVLIGSYTSTKVYLTKYNLDTAVGSTTEIYDAASDISKHVAFYQTGGYFYIVKLLGQVTATHNCPELFNPAGRDVRNAVDLIIDVTAIRLNGLETGWQATLDQVTGHDCYVIFPRTSYEDGVGIHPDGVAYVDITWERAYSDSDCPDTPYVLGIPGAPETAEIKKGYYRLDTFNPGFYTPLTTTSTTVGGGISSLTGYIGPTRLDFHSRTDPMGLRFRDSYTCLFHWNDTSEDQIDVWSQSGWGVGTYITEDCGQRNDDWSILLSSNYLSGGNRHNVFRDIDGNAYLDRIIGSYYPVVGFIGRFPVRHFTGEWVIYGPNTPPIVGGPRWQVV